MKVGAKKNRRSPGSGTPSHAYSRASPPPTAPWDEKKNRRAGGQAPPIGEKQPSAPADKCDDPADEQPDSDSLRKIDPTNGRHNQVTENQEHAGNADETSHDQTKECVKKKIPQADA